MTEILTRISVISVILVCCIVVTAPMVVLAQGGIQSVEISGDGVIKEEDGVTYLWDDESYEVSVRFQDYPDQDNYILCLDKYMDGSEELCREESDLVEGEEVTVYINTFPEEAGERRMRVRLHGDNLGFDNPKKDEVTFTMNFLRKNGDVDNDGLSNQEEIESNLDFTNQDMDDDGLSDGDEVNQYNTEPAETDSDSDGLSDGDEVNQHNTDPSEADSDGDELSDGDEVNQYNTEPTETDSDGDGLADNEELNQHNTDPTAADTDGDRLSDSNELEQHSTDPTETDTDGDGYSDGDEVNEHNTDPTDAKDMPDEGDDDGGDVGSGDGAGDGDGDGAGDGDGDGAGDGDGQATTEQPGFGVAIALVALVAGAIIMVNRRRKE